MVTMRPRNLVFVALLVAMASVALAQPGALPVEDWSKAPLGHTGIPPGWQKQTWGSPKYDFKIEAEYKLEKASNSGIYLRGRYELQVLDDFTQNAAEPFLGHMAIYGRTAPSAKASKPAGEWQSMSAVLVGNRVTLTLNGQRLHDNQVIEGITGGALDADELSPGPILIQGDHSKVWFRKVIVTPISK